MYQMENDGPWDSAGDDSAESVKKKKISHLFKWIKIESEKFFSCWTMTKLTVKQKKWFKIKSANKFFVQARQGLEKVKWQVKFINKY